MIIVSLQMSSHPRKTHKRNEYLKVSGNKNYRLTWQGHEEKYTHECSTFNGANTNAATSMQQSQQGNVNRAMTTGQCQSRVKHS